MPCTTAGADRIQNTCISHNMARATFIRSACCSNAWIVDNTNVTWCHGEREQRLCLHRPQSGFSSLPLHNVFWFLSMCLCSIWPIMYEIMFLTTLFGACNTETKNYWREKKLHLMLTFTQRLLLKLEMQHNNYYY